MKYSQQLNGIYRASKDNYRYIVKFINGVSMEGLRFIDGEYAMVEKYFQESNFTESSNYEYLSASLEEGIWLDACIKVNTLIPKQEALKNYSPIYQIY